MYNILIAGVGGQGNLLASRVIAECAIRKKLSVKTSETIGMAQREGAVVSHVRIGENVYSPLIGDGKGDILIGMELAEAARNLNKLNKEAKVMVNDYTIVPAMVSIGKGKYLVSELKEFIKSNFSDGFFIPASQIAIELGNVRATNVVMLGALAKLNILPFSKEDFTQVLQELLPPKLHQMNLKAFEAGLNISPNS